MADGDSPFEAGMPETPSWCTHTFCDDFDHLEAGAFALWDTHGEGITIDNDASTSPPNSASIRCDGNDLASGKCWLVKNFPPPVNGMKFQFRWRPISVASVHGHAVWELSIKGNERYAVELYRADTGADLELCNGLQNCTNIPRQLLPNPNGDEFQKISGEVHFGDGGRIDISIDDRPEVSDAGPLGFDGTNGVLFGLGDIYEQPNASQILVDDVVIDTF